MKMKKIAVYLFVLVLIFSLSSCGKNKAAVGDEASSLSPQNIPEQKQEEFSEKVPEEKKQDKPLQENPEEKPADTQQKEEGELLSPAQPLSPAQLAGTWLLTSGEVEGWVWDAAESQEYAVLYFLPSQDTEISAGTLTVNYESRSGWGEMRQFFYDQELTLLEEPLYEGCGNEEWSVCLGSKSPLNEHGYPLETEYYATLIEENTLLLQQYFTIDGGPGVSYSYFKRILPTILTEEPKMEELAGTDWEVVSFTDGEGREHDRVPGVEDLFIHLDGMGDGFVSWTDTVTGQVISGSNQWILGAGGGILIYEGEREEAWFSGAVTMQETEAMEQGTYSYEMYLYHNGGIIKLSPVEGSGGENTADG